MLTCQWCGKEMVARPWWIHRTEADAEDCTDPWGEYQEPADGDGWEPFAFILPVEIQGGGS